MGKLEGVQAGVDRSECSKAVEVTSQTARWTTGREIRFRLTSMASRYPRAVSPRPVLARPPGRTVTMKTPTQRSCEALWRVSRQSDLLLSVESKRLSDVATTAVIRRPMADPS